MPVPNNMYLGDGVYASFDGSYIWLTIGDGSKIALEPEVYSALTTFARNVAGWKIGEVS